MVPFVRTLWGYCALCGCSEQCRLATDGRNHRGTETQSFFTFFQGAWSPFLFFVLCASASLWFGGCSVSQNHRGTETQSFFTFFQGAWSPFLFLFSVPLRLYGFMVAVHSAGCKLTDGTTEEQRHRVFLPFFREHDLPFFFCSLCLCVSVVWWM